MNIRTYEKQHYAHIHAIMFDADTPLYVGEILYRSAQLYPQRMALIFKDQTYTYQELNTWAERCAYVIQKAGVRHRDNVLICLSNSPAYYAVYFGAWQLGAIVAPLNIFLGSYELKHIVDDAKPALIVTESSRIQQFRDGGYTGPLLTQEEIDAVRSDGVVSEDRISLNSDELCALLYTSGTTGVPKGVMLSSRAILTNIAQIIARLDMSIEATDSIAGVLPLFHVFAQNTCMWTPIFLGVTVMLAPRIERSAILEVLAHKPTVFVGVPALFGLLALMQHAPLQHVRLFASGGDALPDKIRAGFELIYRRKIVNGYGLTETAPVISAMLEDMLAPTNTIGTPVCDVTVEIRADDEVTVLPPGESGCLWVKGDNLMLGYYNAPEATAAVMKSGFFNTGDCAYLDNAGRLVITGREKDLIIHKGFNIYPQEIENILMNHPQVISVGVVGVKDPEVGEQVVAFVQVRTVTSGIELALKKLCQHSIAAYKIPRTFICQTEELPMTSTRKIDKKKLRERATQLMNESA